MRNEDVNSIGPTELVDIIIQASTNAEGDAECDMFSCKEYIKDVNISKYLAVIRNSEIENVLILAYKDGEIKDFLSFEGLDDSVPFEKYEENNAFGFIKKWYDEKAQIYNIHNHPGCYSAAPSKADLFNFALSEDMIEKMSWQIQLDKEYYEKEYEKFGLPKSFYYGWGVVTKNDFFLSTEVGNKKIQELIKEKLC